MAEGIWGWLTLFRGVDEPNWWTLRSTQQRAIDTTAGGVQQLVQLGKNRIPIKLLIPYPYKST
jgi:hypothetical protein